jgi:hypothetical protein
VPCLSLSTGLSSNPISGSESQERLSTPGCRGYARCWMRVAKRSTVGDLGAQARNTPVAC